MRSWLPVFVVFTLLLAACRPALAAEECQWLPVAQVGEALAAFGPWRTTGGGKVGACQFLGRSRNGAAILSLTQMVQDSPGKAEDFVASLRKNLDASYAVEPIAALGRRGFSYRPKADAGSDARSSLFLVGHQGRVVAMGSLTLPGALSGASREGFLALTRRAFDLAGDAESLAAATRCAYFDQGVLQKLFKGATFSQQVYGANSCIANAGKRVLMLAIVENVDAGLAQTMAASGDCRIESLPALGAQGNIGFACAQGNARAMVRYLKGGKHFEFSWIPGTEPTEAERDLLVELAQGAYERVR
jgi:alpha-D-ribose 1-methylphosphonate 5-triphosphate synthase subunit PhnG